MKKKISLIICILMLLGVTKTFSMGLGLQANYNAGDLFAPGAALTFKLDQTPFYYAINWDIQSNHVNLGATADYWIINHNLASFAGNPLNFHFGIGAFLNLSFASQFNIATGIRVPLGLSMYLAQGRVEPFFELSPSFGVSFLPSLSINRAFFPITLGFRIWF